MEIMYNRTGKDRKELVTAIADITGAEPIYKGIPACNYQVVFYTIDRNGTLSFDDSADSEEVEVLLELLQEKGFEAEVAEQPESKEELQEENVELNIQMTVDETEAEIVKRIY